MVNHGYLSNRIKNITNSEHIFHVVADHVHVKHMEKINLVKMSAHVFE